MAPLRVCTDCGLKAHSQEDLDLFVKAKRAKHGRQNHCRKCRAKQVSRWSKHNRDKVNAHKRKHYSANREEMRQKAREYQRQKDAENPDRARARNVRSKYGISLKEYQRCMATSHGCEICGKTEDLCYDHCHDSLQFRGVLCNACNKGIGILGDNAEALEKAVAYLKDKEAAQTRADKA